MPGSSKLFRENQHINHLTVLENPISKVKPGKLDTGDYFNKLPTNCEIRKEDRDVINKQKEETNAIQKDAGGQV